MSRHHFFTHLKNSRKKLIFLENNCFRVSHMGCEARFLNLMIFLSFPQSNLIFKASFLNCTAAFFERFRFFQKGCKWTYFGKVFGRISFAKDRQLQISPLNEKQSIEKMEAYLQI